MQRSLFATFLWMSLVQPAQAAWAYPISVEKLARSADAVVQARVEKQQSYQTADGRHIYTLVTLQRSENWKGFTPERFVVRVPGGQIGDLVERSDAAPSFADSEEVVLFLARGPSGQWKVRELGMGKFSVQSDRASPSLAAIQFTKGDIPAGERSVGVMSVQELKSRVKAALGVPESRP